MFPSSIASDNLMDYYFIIFVHFCDVEMIILFLTRLCYAIFFVCVFLFLFPLIIFLSLFLHFSLYLPSLSLPLSLKQYNPLNNNKC